MSASLAVLNMHPFLPVFFLALVAVFIVRDLSRLCRYPCVLDFDGENWCIHEKHQTVMVDLLPESFVSRYFLLLVFKAKTENKWFRYYFSGKNCTQADFRALCRLSHRH
jgi:hypothetical protein